MDDQLKAIISSGRDKLDTAIPDPAVFTLLMRKLEVRKLKKRRVYFLKVASLSGIAAVLLIGFFVMFFADKSESRRQVKVNSTDSAQVKEQTLAETYLSVDTFLNEMDNLKDTRNTKLNATALPGQQLVFLVSSSPSTRITAIYTADTQRKNSKPLFDALFEVLNNDPNANVRMAALDVLTTHLNDALIRKRLVYAMVEQDEPMVQLMMIQLFTGSGEKDFVEKLGQIIHDPETDEEVREEARFSYAQYTNSLN